MTYTCAACGGTFNSTWTDEEALAEMDAKFGKVPEDQTVCICDDCYQQALAKLLHGLAPLNRRAD